MKLYTHKYKNSLCISLHSYAAKVLHLFKQPAAVNTETIFISPHSASLILCMTHYCGRCRMRTRVRRRHTNMHIILWVSISGFFRTSMSWHLHLVPTPLDVHHLGELATRCPYGPFRGIFLKNEVPIEVRTSEYWSITQSVFQLGQRG